MPLYEGDAWDAAADFPEFTKEEIECFIDAFRQYDADNSGTIDKSELKEALKGMGQGCGDEDVDNLFVLVDKDNTGLITFDRWLKVMRYFYPNRRVEFERDFIVPSRDFPEFTRPEIYVFADCFRDANTSRSGTMDVDELDEALRSMGEGCTKEEAKRILAAVDADSSGTLDFGEFLEVMRFKYAWKIRKFAREFLEPSREFVEFTRAEILSFVNAFREFDIDGSGTIDAQELTEMLKSMGQGASESQVQALLQEFCKDGSGQLRWPEFLAIMRHFYPHRREEYVEEFYTPAKDFPEFTQEDVDVFVQVFRDFDIDGNGTIDIDELDLAFRSMGQGCSREKLQKIIDEVDSEGIGAITFAGFLKVMRNLYSHRTTDVAPSSTSAASSSSVPARAANTTSAAPAPAPAPAATPAKAASPASSSAAAAPASPAPSSGGFKTAAPRTTSSPSMGAAAGAQRGATSKCVQCGKSAYPNESVAVDTQTWHKICFKCQEPGCGITLNLKTFTILRGVLYCQKHVPKAKATAVSASDSLHMASALSAPKLNKQTGIRKDRRVSMSAARVKLLEEQQQQQQQGQQ